MTKVYTTRHQREALESIGIPHEKGRTRDEADVMIKSAIERGELPRNCIDPPSEKQIAFLQKHNVQFRNDITGTESSELIGAKIDELDSNEPMTMKQAELIHKLGGKPVLK
ncbi:MAG: hypothetical protein K9M45_05765 [Kiritimatiellales bacterium]|nr:hypothetical protein [Kiritimatiellales bacterium]